MNRYIRRSALALALPLLALSACDQQPVSPAAEQAGLLADRGAEGLSRRDIALLKAVRRANARYENIENAIADGFVPASPCVALPGVGAMGIHYVHPARAGVEMRGPLVHIGDGVLVPEKPEVLIYEPQSNGGMRFVALEYMVSREAWGSDVPPVMFGHPFDTLFDDPATPQNEANGFTDHFAMHVWLWRRNPAGLFVPFNREVSCAAAPVSGVHPGH